jgi:hypothetical protein
MNLLTQILDYLQRHSALAPILSALIVASAAIWVTGRAAPNFARLLKKTDAALDFGKRYVDLMILKDEINRKHQGADHGDRTAAEDFYYRYFDLIMNEYRFFRSGFLDGELFSEWMAWRWQEYNDPQRRFVVCGTSCRDGWEYWKRRSVFGNREFLRFIDRLHTEPKSAEDAQRFTQEFASSWRMRAVARRAWLWSRLRKRQ